MKKPVKKSTTKSPSNISNLDDFSRVIESIGERRRKEEDEVLKRMKAQAGDLKKKLRKMTNKELLEYFQQIPFSTSDPRQMVHWQEIRIYAKDQILKRMK